MFVVSRRPPGRPREGPWMALGGLRSPRGQNPKFKKPMLVAGPFLLPSFLGARGAAGKVFVAGSGLKFGSVLTTRGSDALVAANR